MKSLSVHKIWILMILLTVSTYVIGKLGYSGTIVMLLLLATAIVKSIYIIRDFMELKGVSFLWRAIMYGWLWTVCVSIAVIYLIST